MNDLLKQLAVAIRSVAREGADPDELVRVTLRRSYPTTADDLWDALTAPARIARWMTPISGDLTVAGTFQLEGNAGGEILACEPPRLLRATWGDASSIVSVVLAPVGPEETELELSHTVPVALAGSVAGALFVGPGWDEALLGLAEYLDGRPAGPTVANSPEALDYSYRSVLLWTDVVTGAGATADETEFARQAAMAQFAPHVTV